MTTAVHENPAVSLSISLVCYKSDPQLLLATLNSLRAALRYAEQQRALVTTLTVVDNGNDSESLQRLITQSGLQPYCELISNDHNAGFGKANNQVIDNAASDFHLVLNPDVELDNAALQLAISYLQQQPSIAAVSPACRNGDGATEYLCKRYPSLRMLFLRGFAPHWLQRRCADAMAHYECRELAACTSATAVELISGCFMLCRTAALQQAGGFDESYFLYFEDFALSIELARIGAIHYLPSCHIVHHGGKAANKGWPHIGYFLQSAWHFYCDYGWKLW